MKATFEYNCSVSIGDWDEEFDEMMSNTDWLITLSVPAHVGMVIRFTNSMKFMCQVSSIEYSYYSGTADILLKRLDVKDDLL